MTRREAGSGGRAERGREGRDERDAASPDPVSRRRFLTGAAALGSAAWAGTSGIAAGIDRVFGPADAVWPVDAREGQQAGPPDATGGDGRPVYEPTGAGLPSPLGRRSTFERPRRRVSIPEPSGSSLTPLQSLNGIITPADLHFERHHSGIPFLDPHDYRLLVHGMVERPTTFTLRDLARFPRRSVIRFVECAGNGVFGYRETSPAMTPDIVAGLTATSEWTGVPLSLLFREVGVEPDAKWFLAEGDDPGHYARSIPVAKAWDDAMIVFGQNGEAIRPEQGYPARLLVPGFEGSANIKWIRRIELSDAPFMTRAETSEYTEPLPNGTARIFSLVMDASSIITFPAHPVTLREEGWWEITGLAWSGRGRIEHVEVTTDGGRTWERARLEEPVLPRCHTRFRHVWRWTGDGHLLASRAVDETGYVQPTRRALLDVRGEANQYHLNSIRAWQVTPEGHVRFAGGGEL